MATERFEMSSAPWGEDGAQVGEEGYELRARQECRRYQAQLLRHYAANHGGRQLPEGCRLIVKGHSHDFGTYYEEHHTCVCHPTLAFARQTRSPLEFCDDCRAKTECEEGGTCHFTPDLEYDASGNHTSCEKCGRLENER